MIYINIFLQILTFERKSWQFLLESS